MLIQGSVVLISARTCPILSHMQGFGAVGGTRTAAEGRDQPASHMDLHQYSALYDRLLQSGFKEADVRQALEALPQACPPVLWRLIE